MSLIQERVSPYDVLARKLTNKCLSIVKDYITGDLEYNEDNYNFLGGISFEIAYRFPSRGLSKGIDMLLDFHINPPDRKFRGPFYVSGAAEEEILDIVLQIKDVSKGGIFGSTDLDVSLLKDIYYDLLHIIRHELEHQAQDHRSRSNSIPIQHYNQFSDRLKRIRHSHQEAPGLKGRSKQIRYNTELDSEIEAELKSYYLMSKKTGIPMEKLIKKFFNSIYVNNKDIGYVLDKWRKYAKEHFPYMKF